MRALEARHFADLTFREVSRGLRALSATYVERRARLTEGGALGGAGKRAAFALFYGPLHYLIVRHIVQHLPGAARSAPVLVDLGSGTGASGAAWASLLAPPPQVLAVDRNPWALAEARWTYGIFGVTARTRQGSIAAVTLPKPPALVLAAFTLNEIAAADRDRLLSQLVERTARGDRLLVVEPLARPVAPWWQKWSRAVVEAGGRVDQWRFEATLPQIVADLDRAARLDHRELTGRSLWLSRSG